LKQENEKTNADNNFTNRLNSQNEAFNQKLALADNDSLKQVIQKQKDRTISNIKPSEIKGLSPTDQNKLVAAQNDSNRYGNLKNELEQCRTLKIHFDNADNLKAKLDTSNVLKNKLENICAQSKDSLLLAYSKELRPYKPSSIQSIKQFYIWLGENLGIIKKGETNEERKMLIVMSLTTSIVIDILPLLFSLLFVLYRRND
jgi:hypothetical protein